MVSILGDIDDQIKAADEAVKVIIEEWIKENYTCTALKISDKPNRDGLYEVTANSVEVKNITSFTNGFFVWKNVENFFFCNCLKLKSLEGAPEVSGNYYCTNCYSLNANGIPDEIRGKVVFNCEGCKKSGLFVFRDFTFGDENEAKPYVKITDEYNCATPELEFVEKVKDVYIKKVRPSIINMRNSHWLIKYLICTIKDIPIHFGRQKDYKDYDDGKYLGLYRRNKDNTREIILFKDAIKAEAKGDNDYLENLIWKVIIHEYAHAMMDTLQDNKIKSQNPKLYKYREESLANAFALRTLKSEENYFGKIKKFVESQSEEYKLGLDLYEREDLFKMMEFWREMKILADKIF